MNSGNELIPHVLEGEIVPQRIKDGYINATAMCSAAGKLWADYNRLNSTKEFYEALSADMGIPISELIQSVRGGFPEFQGTWVHPQIAIHLAQWLSPRFAVQVAKWVHEWLTTGATPAQPVLPFHLRRYLANYRNVPVGHFSVLTEMTLGLIAPLEMMGYTLPERMWPDISQGRMFAKWLREEHGLEPLTMPKYLHEFEDDRWPVRAIAYPEDLLHPFRVHFRDVWLPQRSMQYFRERDKKALEFLPRLLPKPNSKAS